jgi:hypothetical protein
MTLLLRRKRPTTAPSSTKEKAATSPWGRRLACRLPLSVRAKVAALGSRAYVAAVATGITLGAYGTLSAQEPQPLPQDIEARPINDADADATPNVLRWKSKPVPTTNYSTSTSQPISDTSSQPLRAGWNITRIDPNVRPAQHSDPFNDPFGDKKNSATASRASNDGPALVLQPTQAEAGIEELPPPRALSPMRTAELPPPLLNVAQRGSAPSGAPPDMALPSDAPCDRKYNDRDCCKLEADCHAFRNRLLSDSIRNISLDITPPFKHDPNVTEDEARADKMRLQGVRQWRNRRGAVIATGRITDIQNGAVILLDDSGSEVARIPVSELGEDELCYVSAMWDLPSECPLGGLRTAQRTWLASTLLYHASSICHKPLYFEEVQLERYGHTAGPFRQPIISGAHFMLNLAMLPYHMGINPPTECQYPLGYYRPGSCAPWMIPPIPLSLEGAKWEIATALGMIYLIP